MSKTHVKIHVLSFSGPDGPENYLREYFIKMYNSVN